MRTMQAKRSRFRSVAFVLVSLLFFAVAAPTGCGQEPVIVVDLAAWPAGVERIRVLPSVNGTVNADILLDPSQRRFAVRVPAGTAGTVHLEAVGLDGMGCKLAVGSLTEPVPDNLSRFVERTLELQRLTASVCGPDPVNLPVILVDIAAWPAGVERIRVRWSLNGTAMPDILLDPSQKQFNLPLPAGSAGNVHLGAVGLDAAGGCKLAIASLDVPVPENLSHFAEVTLTFEQLPTPVCIFASSSDFPAGNKPYSVMVGDFNQDQRLDLAIANSGGQHVSVLLGNGMGRFAGANNFPVGMSPISVAVGDA